MNGVLRVLVYAYRVSWGDMCEFKRSILPVLVTCLVGPLLYLIGFGYGLGNGLTMEGYDYIAFLLPGVIAMTTLTACFSFTSSKIYVQKTFFRSIDEMLLCPIPVSSIVLGKSMMGMVRGLMSCMILIVMASLLSSDFHVTMWLILAVILCCLVFSFLGVSAGLLMKKHTDIGLFNSLIITPMTFLCGTVFSLNAMPQVVRYVINLLPLTHAVDMIRSLSLGQSFPWISLVVISVFGAIFFSMAYYVVRRGNL